LNFSFQPDSLGAIPTQSLTIRSVTVSDAATIAEIYNHYVANTVVTFDVEPVSVLSMTERISETIPSFPWFVLELEGVLVGYAGAGPWKSRCAYQYAVESTIYLRVDCAGKGLGTPLYHRLIEEVRRLGFHSMIGGVALPNPPSQRLHEKLGFKKIAQFEQVGWKFERWIDVGYWQLLL
jgi:phosphinothricin acetyltransferase